MELAQLPRPLSRTAASLSSASDDELIAEIIVGSHAAFEALYQRHSPGMLGMARQMLGSPTEAEDAVQHAFIAAYRELEGGVTPTHPRAWLYAIARNRCLNVLRDRREVANPEAAEAQLSTVGLAEEVERRSELRSLLRDMHRLPEEQRTALALFEMGGLSQAEIAQAMGTDEGRVKALVYQARTNLAHSRAASNATCAGVREQLATLRGGRLNTRLLRDHVRDCRGCAEFAMEVREQRRRLAIVLPVIPLMAAKAPAVVAGGAAVGTVSSNGAHAVGSVGRKLYWLRPRPSVIAAVAATGVVSAAAVAAVATGGGDHPPKRDRPAAIAAAPAAALPAAKPVAVAKPAAKPKPAHKAKAHHKARRKTKAKKATPAPAPAPKVTPAAATPDPTPAPTPAATPAPVAAAPPHHASPPPAAPADPPGQNFDLGDPGTPEAPSSETGP